MFKFKIMDRFKNFMGFIYKHHDVLILITGILCIVLREQIISILPYVFGGVVLLAGVAGIFFGLINIIKSHHRQYVLAYSLLMIIFGTIFLTQGGKEVDLLYIGTCWGVVGAIKGGAQLAVAIEEAYDKNLNCIYSFIISAFTIAISVILLLNPAKEVGHHVLILGIELTIVSLASFIHLRELSLWNVFSVGEKKKEKKEENEKS